MAPYVNADETGGIFLRLLTAGVAMLIVCAIGFYQPLRAVFDILIALLVAVGMFEFYGLVRAAGIGPESFWGTLGGVWIVIETHQGRLNQGLLESSLVIAAAHLLRGNRRIAGLATSLFGLLYVAWMGSHVILLRSLAGDGVGHIMILFAIVWLTDAGAYGVGRAFGRHSLPSAVSPNKTLEGCLGGIVFALMGAAILKEFQRIGATALPDYALSKYLLIGFLLSVAVQLGDLTESYFKRDAGVKDSGRFFPGHGGLLDRCDGMLFAAPVLYYLTKQWL